jgi:mannosyltransferase OCH1-like enzyme
MMRGVGGIPRILHQTWRTRELSSKFERCRDSWLQHHRGWEHRFYDDAACRVVVQLCGGDWLEAYDRLPMAIQRADLFRYLVVFAYGGVYADVDMFCYRAIDKLVDGACCVLSIEAHLTEERRRELRYRKSRQIANCIFAAEPQHPFLGALLTHIKNSDRFNVMKDGDVEESTGPRMLTRVFEHLDVVEQSTIRVLPQILLMAPRECPFVPFGPPIHARHLVAGTWKQEAGPASLKRWWIERNLVPPLWPRLPQGASN